MAIDSNFFELFFEFTSAQITAFVDSSLGEVSRAVQPVANSLLAIYVILHGISIAYGKINEPIADSIFKLLRIGVIFGIAFNADNYRVYVTDIALNAPESMASLFSSGPAEESSSVNSIDRALNTGWAAGTRYYDEAGVFEGEFGYYLIAMFVWGATLLFCLYSAFLMLLSKIAIAVLIAVGPIFIVMVLFDSTKKFFESWTSQLLNYMLLQIVTAALLGLVITMFTEEAIKAQNGELGMDHCLFMIVIALLSTLVIQQSPSIASGLAGGASLSTQGAFGMAMSKAMGAAKAGFNRTPLGRSLAASREARQSARNQLAQSTGKALNARRYGPDKGSQDTKTESKSSIDRAGEMAANRHISPMQMAKSATTNWRESMGRLRTRLAARP